MRNQRDAKIAIELPKAIREYAHDPQSVSLAAKVMQQKE